MLARKTPDSGVRCGGSLSRYPVVTIGWAYGARKIQCCVSQLRSKSGRMCAHGGQERVQDLGVGLAEQRMVHGQIVAEIDEMQTAVVRGRQEIGVFDQGQKGEVAVVDVQPVHARARAGGRSPRISDVGAVVLGARVALHELGRQLRGELVEQACGQRDEQAVEAMHLARRRCALRRQPVARADALGRRRPSARCRRGHGCARRARRRAAGSRPRR